MTRLWQSPTNVLRAVDHILRRQVRKHKLVGKISSSIQFKPLLAGAALIGLVVLSALILWPSPCDGIFEQTARKLDVNLKIIENEGAFVVSRQSVHKLSESAQKVGLHLKTCCSVLEGGKLNPNQFQQCIDKASGYEKQVADVAQQVTEASKAKIAGDSNIAKTKIKRINQTVEIAADRAEMLAKFVEKELIPSPFTQELRAAHREQEPNDQITNGTGIRLGDRIRGELSKDKDRRDYFKFRTSERASGNIRVIVRKLVGGGFAAKVIVYDPVENRVASGYAYHDDPVTFSFGSTAKSEYFVLIKGYNSGALGPYELEVREE